MRIHSDTLDMSALMHAAETARVLMTTNDRHGSKKRDHAYEVKLSGDSPFRQNGGSDFAATWDQWGIFLNALWEADPDMTCGGYKDRKTFDYATGGRFRHLTFENSHRRHRWQPTYAYEAYCECGAVWRWDHLVRR